MKDGYSKILELGYNVFMRDNVIVEFTQVGNVVKVTAICMRTGVEVSMVGDPNVPQPRLIQLAKQKLNYVKNKPKPKSKR